MQSLPHPGGRDSLEVRAPNADEVESVAEQRTFDLPIERGVRIHAWAEINLDEPWLQIFIDEDVEPIKLKTACLVLRVLPHFGRDERLNGEERFDYKVVDARPHQINVGTCTLEVPVERGDAPLVPYIIRLKLLVLNEVTAELVDGIIGEVAVGVFEVLFRGAIWFRGKSRQPFPIDVNAKRVIRSDEDINPHIKLQILDQQRVVNVAGHHGHVPKRQIFQISEQENPFPL
mmetsp:Transcript_46818/g.130386  ORF Transcript_46818/g.130386 Transcript_46818/m.130386 type:complete len:231 (+) Transcript_46818:989-1681(+)